MTKFFLGSNPDSNHRQTCDGASANRSVLQNILDIDFLNIFCFAFRIQSIRYRMMNSSQKYYQKMTVSVCYPLEKEGSRPTKSRASVSRGGGSWTLRVRGNRLVWTSPFNFQLIRLACPRLPKTNEKKICTFISHPHSFLIKFNVSLRATIMDVDLLFSHAI